jgi:hypothetical protein
MTIQRALQLIILPRFSACPRKSGAAAASAAPAWALASAILRSSSLRVDA